MRMFISIEMIASDWYRVFYIVYVFKEYYFTRYLLIICNKDHFHSIERISANG